MQLNEESIQREAHERNEEREGEEEIGVQKAEVRNGKVKSDAEKRIVSVAKLWGSMKKSIQREVHETNMEI